MEVGPGSKVGWVEGHDPMVSGVGGDTAKPLRMLLDAGQGANPQWDVDR